ncbi:MAG: hypothetical protein GY725_04625 [bacterium]|nr:hypothetical protein [bacterium]
MAELPPPLSRQELTRFHKTLSNWGRWGEKDQLGMLNLITRSKRVDAALGCDGVTDVIPSRVPEVRLPIHSIAIPILGLHLIDNLQLDDLARVCREEERIEFQLTIAPLVLERGTASPVNPIALF